MRGVSCLVVVHGETGTGKSFHTLGHSKRDGLFTQVAAGIAEQVMHKVASPGRSRVTMELTLAEIYMEKV